MTNRRVIPTEIPGATLIQLDYDTAKPFFDGINSERERLDRYESTVARDFPKHESLLESIDAADVAHRLRYGLWLDDEFAGSVHVRTKGDVAEVGYWLLEAHTHKGLATAGLRALINEAPLWYTHVARVHPHNDASKRVLDRNGFSSDGRQAGRDVFTLVQEHEPLEQEPVMYDHTQLRTTDLSRARIGLRGTNDTFRNGTSVSTYRVRYGEGTIYVNGKSNTAQVDSVVTVLPGDWYHDEGHMVLERVSEPPYDMNDIELITKQQAERWAALYELCKGSAEYFKVTDFARQLGRSHLSSDTSVLEDITELRKRGMIEWAKHNKNGTKTDHAWFKLCISDKWNFIDADVRLAS